MSNYFHPNEQQARDEREQSLFARLPEFIAKAQQNSPHYQARFADIDAKSINTRAKLAQLPITRKSELIQLQKKQRPFAGINAQNAQLSRIFQSPGPIYDPENCQHDWWRMGQAFAAAGFVAGDMVQNCLSYHLTPGGFMLDSGAQAVGCSVIPAGPGQTEQQLDIIEDLKPQGYCGTPSFLKILLAKAKQQGRDVSSLNKALVTGEALPQTLRDEFTHAGIDVLQAYASADVGLIAYESIADEGLIIAEDLIVEIVRPGSLEPVADGEIGEVVVTSFNNDYPLIRFATGDLSAIKSGVSACGRSNMRIKGWLGRADQTTKIKGMFVHPEQIERVRLTHQNLPKARLTVSQKNHQDQMHLQCEFDAKSGTDTDIDTAHLLAALKESLQQFTKLNGSVELMALGSLPDDGKVIDDKRVIN
ncbi:MAG: phenylacetate--CoA ligase family protein [Cognaticolwellia sp.]